MDNVYRQSIYCLQGLLFDKALCDRQNLIMIVASYVNLTGEESDE